MRNIKAVVQYDGSRYFGFQAQLDPENLPTVQEELEAAIGGLLKEETKEFVEEKKGYVEFKNVSFRYPDADTEILEDITFTARPRRNYSINWKYRKW